MESRYIEEFVALAECLNYTETASHFNISQPTLSRHIVRLEEELQAQLFLRNTRAVHLTEAGKKFLPHAQQIVECCRRAATELHAYNRTCSGALTIGFRALYSQDFVLHRIVDAFARKYPSVQLNFLSTSSPGVLHEWLLRNEVDLLMTMPFKDTGSGMFCSQTIGKFPLCAVVHPEHPFAAKKEITFSDLNGQKIILPDPSNHHDATDILRDILYAYSVAPASYSYVKCVEEADMRIALYHEINLIPECYCNDSFDSINRVIPIAGTEDLFPVLFVWKEGAENPYIGKFVHMLNQK